MSKKKSEYEQIKKLWGEEFAKLCRELFPQILEEKGKLIEILKKNFATNSCSLGKDISSNPELIEEFKEYIFAQYDEEREDLDETSNFEKTPYEILDEAGYDLYECKNEDEIQGFRKYYTPNELLCTIYIGGRLNSCYCFWAVKKDIENIKRKEFENPNKTDEYSLSVLAIQFDRKTGRVEIISRYNHTVPTPNCTLGNNLDKLAPGLSKSFANLFEERNLNINLESQKSFEIPGYTVANDGKYYKYNHEINGVYYCPGNIVIKGGEPKTIISSEKGILADYFCIDTQNKTISACNGIMDSFVDDLQDIQKIEVEKSDRDGEAKIIKIFKTEIKEPIIIGINKENEIVRYENMHLKKAGDGFLLCNQSLTSLELPALKEIGDGFLGSNSSLTSLELLKLEQAGNGFLWNNRGLISLELPKLEQAGNNFLYYNQSLTSLELPALKEVGDCFLFYNQSLTSLELPKLEQAGNGFLYDNQSLTNLKLPKLEQAGDGFLLCNQSLTSLELPALKEIGDGFLGSNSSLTSLELPELEQVGDDFLYHNQSLTSLELPKLKKVRACFLFYNQSLTSLKLPALKEVGDCFLFYNQSLTSLELPALKEIGGGFLGSNSSLTSLELPKLEQTGDNFLCNNQSLASLKLPKLKKVRDNFLCNNQSLTSLELPVLKEVGDCFLLYNQSLANLELPKLKQAGDCFLYNNQSLVNLILTSLPIEECKELLDRMINISVKGRKKLLSYIITDKAVKQTEDTVTTDDMDNIAKQLIELEEEKEGKEDKKDISDE